MHQYSLFHTSISLQIIILFYFLHFVLLVPVASPFMHSWLPLPSLHPSLPFHQSHRPEVVVTRYLLRFDYYVPPSIIIIGWLGREKWCGQRQENSAGEEQRRRVWIRFLSSLLLVILKVCSGGCGGQAEARFYGVMNRSLLCHSHLLYLFFRRKCMNHFFVLFPYRRYSGYIKEEI